MTSEPQATKDRIVRTKGTCGGVWRIFGTRIPLWVLRSYRSQGFSDRKILAQFPSLTQDDLNAAWNFTPRKDSSDE